jgi:hypothetical protein
MAKDLFDEVAEETPSISTKKDQFEEVAKQQKIMKTIDPFSEDYDPFSARAEHLKLEKPVDISPIAEAFARGGRRGVSGLLMGYKPDKPPTDETWLEHLAALAGELSSDLPGFWAGGELGAMAGATVGSIIPGVGTAGGALGGAAAGAMAFPTMIKHSFNEYRDFVDKGGNLSFGEFLESTGRVASETGKAGVVGLATAGMSKFLPFLKKIPKFDRILNTKPGKIATQTALELAGLTGTQAALEGQLPSAEQVADNAAALLGMKMAHGISGKIKKFTRRPLVEPKVKITEPKAKGAFEKVAKEILPIDWEKRAEAKVKRAKYEDLLKDYLGSKNAKTVESAFKWREKQASYEKKGGKFTPEQLKEMTYYAQKTGNPAKGIGDSFTDVSERLPAHAKEFVDKVMRPHLKESLRAWNDHPATKNINPREGLEEFYLPGLYKDATPAQIKAVEHKVRTKFKIKNPFSDTKAFMTYNEAALEAGLKPLYDNPVELMKHYDKVNIKLMHNAELLDMVRKFQTHNKDQIIVTSNNPREYAKASKNGYVEFEDPFLRSYKDKERQFKITEKPALVEPEFAKAFSGVFSKEAFRPDSNFWKVADKIKNQMNFMRVAMSPFHYVAEMESILGQRGLKGFRLLNMASEGRKLRSNKDFMVDAARHGLKITERIEAESLRKGNAYLERGLDYMAENKNSKAAKSLKNAMTYLFDEFIPNAKAVSYDEAIKTQTAKLEKQQGKKLAPQEVKELKRTVAEHMNNIYGGQNWEQSKVFRDPKVRKNFRRAFAFSDWTVSAIKQAMSTLKPGLGGNMARKYLAKYIMYTGGTAAILRGLWGGLEQTDEKNNSVKGVKWSPQKAVNALVDVKGLKDLFSFTLPDLDIKIGKDGPVINMGRNEDGTRMKGHFGKQLLEVKGWLSGTDSFVRTFFNKANPVFTAAFKQAFGVTPSDYGPFMEKMGFFRGRAKPWKGKRGIPKLVERAKTLVSEFVPFGMRGGAKQWVSTFGGAFPVGKEYTLFKSEDDIESALLDKDKKRGKEKLGAIRALLKVNRVEDADIKKRINIVKGQIRRDRYSDRVEDALLIKDDAKRASSISSLKKDMAKDELGFSAASINGLFKSTKRRLKMKGKI